jgi:CheY-like chemotaxis protein
VGGLYSAAARSFASLNYFKISFMETLDSFATAYPLSILIADEHPSAQADAKEMLAGLGYCPEVAGSGADLLRMTSAQLYDVILTDITMPGLEDLLNNPAPGPDVRPLIIAKAAPHRPDFKAVCRQTQVDHCITGPVTPADLLLQLKACSVLAGKCRVYYRG